MPFGGGATLPSIIIIIFLFFFVSLLVVREMRGIYRAWKLMTYFTLNISILINEPGGGALCFY